MGRDRTVKAEQDRIEISDGDWIEVKRELNVGDQKKLESAGLAKPVMVDGQVYYPVDWELHPFERALVFLTNWSLSGPNGALPLDLSSMRALDTDTFDEINKAILKHRIEEAEAKKARREATKPPAPTSMPAPSEPVPTLS